MSEISPLTKSPDQTKLATWAILFCTIIWGSVFFLTKLSVESIPVFIFQAIRHLLAFFCFLPFARHLKIIKKDMVLGTFYCACSSFFMLAFQTFGLKTTTASKGAFIAALYIVLTPLMAWIVFRRKVQLKHIISICITVVGMMVLMLFATNSDGNMALGEVNLGDFLIFIGAAFNALQIVIFEKYVTKEGADLFAINLLYMLFMTLLSVLCSLLFQESYAWEVSPNLIWIWVYMGVVTTALTLVIQFWAQQRIESTRAAIIFSFEAVFGTFFGIIFLDETLAWQFIVGAGLIMTGVLIASIDSKTKKPL